MVEDTGTSQNIAARQYTDLSKLKIVLIRHGEKPLKGDNLNCKGLNRSKLLPAVITARFGIPHFVYVPQMVMGTATLQSRMFQTIIPLVALYNLTVNTAHQQHDYEQIAADFKSKTGTILVTWEHEAIPFIVKALGVNVEGLTWPDDDFDSIWIITFPKGVPALTKDKEGLEPLEKCNF